MRKGQGAKDRATYPEAYYGADGIVGFFLAKQKERELAAKIVGALEKLPKRSAVQSRFLAEQQTKLAGLNDEIAHITEHAPAENPTFFDGLAKAHKVKAPVYPEEARVLEKYAYLRFVKPIMEQTIEEMETRPLPGPTHVSYDDLFAASQDENGSPDKFQFSRIVKRYRLELKRGTPGRKSQVVRLSRAKRTA